MSIMGIQYVKAHTDRNIVSCNWVFKGSWHFQVQLNTDLIIVYTIIEKIKLKMLAEFWKAGSGS